MRDLIKRMFGRQQTYKPGPAPPPRVVLTESSIDALSECVDSERRRHHEGIAYLLGQTDGTTTIVVAAIRPEATTTRGSFSVSAVAMAQVVRTATKAGLQVVGQVHTHPGEAYHSDGDVEGARIVYRGFVSIVLPDYGRWLPALDGAACYIFRGDAGFVEIALDNIGIVPARL
ncbi:MAG TPA: Mov34/MPN/PAD-1 family protein [Woeseiaceae bacterium]|nr:Mov34/MPN/PAD-1 family protein [Woeseiaceae bacterium]